MKDQDVEKLEKAFENDMLIFKEAVELLCINSAVVETELLRGRKHQFESDIECLIDDPAWNILKILGERYNMWKTVYPLVQRFKNYVIGKLPTVDSDEIYNFITEEMLNDLMQEIKFIWDAGGDSDCCQIEEEDYYNDYR